MSVFVEWANLMFASFLVPICILWYWWTEVEQIRISGRAIGNSVIFFFCNWERFTNRSVFLSGRVFERLVTSSFIYGIWLLSWKCAPISCGLQPIHHDKICRARPILPAWFCGVSVSRGSDRIRLVSPSCSCLRPELLLASDRSCFASPSRLAFPSVALSYLPSRNSLCFCRCCLSYVVSGVVWCLSSVFTSPYCLFVRRTLAVSFV